MFENFDFEVASIFNMAEEEQLNLHHSYVGTEHLLLAILKFKNDMQMFLNDYGITYEDVKETLINLVGIPKKIPELSLYTPVLKEIIDSCLLTNKLVKTKDLLNAILDNEDTLAYKILVDLDFPITEVQDELSTPREFTKKNLEVLKIGVRLNNQISLNETIVGREKEIELMIETLIRRQKNNPLLIGEAGVGKTALVEELARRIKKHEVPKELENKEIIMLEMASLVAGTKYRGEFEERLNKIIKEVIKEKNIILFIDEIHSMVNAGGAEGAISAGDILKPYLARGEFKIIGATTTNEYHEFLENDKALDRRFEKIMIEEPNKEDMLEILFAIKPNIEHHYKIKLTTENIFDFYNLSEEYLTYKYNPDKVIELIDSVCARLKLKKSRQNDLEKIQKLKVKYLQEGNYEEAINAKSKETNILKNEIVIKKEDIIEVIEAKTHINISENKMDKLKDALSSIVGQTNAINTLLEGLSNSSKKFLLVGSSGVGKTETVKLISDALNTKLLQIDMSEYTSIEDINKLIGSPSGYVGYNDSYVFEKLKDNAYTTILFDEVEKAHPKILNILLQILDEGYITSSKGTKISFKHAYIFLTSNAKGTNHVGFGASSKKNFDGYFKKELLGRIDKIIEYENISHDVALEYVKNNLKNQNISYERILSESEYNKYGLRYLKKLITKYNKEVKQFAKM